MSYFVNYIKTLVELPVDQERKLLKIISKRKIKENDNFIVAGQHPKTIAFVCKGLFRYYYSGDQGEEFTKAFFTENSVLISYSAIIQNRGSYFTAQAIEDSEIEVVNYDRLLDLFSEWEGWNKFLVVMLQKVFFVKEERERQFLLFDAEKRYRSFLEQFPNLDKRISQHLIASYLRITPESLSRLRRKMGFLS